jgi:hypothetical protein
VAVGRAPRWASASLPRPLWSRWPLPLQRAASTGWRCLRGGGRFSGGAARLLGWGGKQPVSSTGAALSRATSCWRRSGWHRLLRPVELGRGSGPLSVGSGRCQRRRRRHDRGFGDPSTAAAAAGSRADGSRMHGAMGATAAGRSPLGWRERFAPRPPAEALAWASTSWRLADSLEDRPSGRSARPVQRPDPPAAGDRRPSTGQRSLTPRVTPWCLDLVHDGRGGGVRRPGSSSRRPEVGCGSPVAPAA